MRVKELYVCCRINRWQNILIYLLADLAAVQNGRKKKHKKTGEYVRSKPLLKLQLGTNKSNAKQVFFVVLIHIISVCPIFRKKLTIVNQIFES